jgi:hypothetical protein
MSSERRSVTEEEVQQQQELPIEQVVIVQPNDVLCGRQIESYRHGKRNNIIIIDRF